MPKDAIVVPDAHLLFHGDFKRAGVDLILSGDDREIVLHDYFKGEKRAALSSPDGAHLTGDIVNALTGSVQVSQADGNASVAKVIGHVTKLVGTATATRNGVSILLHQGDNVEKGDVVQSGSDSTLGITFIDGTVFGLSSNARMVLNDMVYDPNGSNNSSLLSLVAGTISFVAGQTAKHGDMKIDTPVATMGIRGTAVLVEIDFTVPGQSGQPDAKFQVLVEPDGTTGSYVLFDKTTLQPLAVVNQAGQQINISQGVITQTNAPLPPDVQKLINDVFTLKFTDNANPKTDTGHNNSITPQTGPVQKADNGATATPIYVTVNQDGGSTPKGISGGQTTDLLRVPGPPEARLLDLADNPTSVFSITERAGITGDVNDLDTISGKVTFTDPNGGDTPSVKVNFSAFAYQDALHQDVTTKLSLLQLADIAKTEVKISVVPAPGNNNNGSASFTYSVPDNAFDFLAAGEKLTLTYVAQVDNNFAPLNETTLIQFTITVTGTNDDPVITTGPLTIALHGGTSEPGGSLPLTSNDPTSGTLNFNDVDLTDTHTVTVALTGKVLPGGSIPPAPLAFFEQALSASITTDSTGTGIGKVNWTFADIPVYDADFIPKGATLTLTYTVTVTDEHGATSTQTVTVTITGTDAPAVVWIATTTGEASGGLWSDAANWETGTVPLASDDVIIITDQLHGLTPSYPVTIDAPAFAKSLTMSDFGTYAGSAPKLIVDNVDQADQNSLTIGGDFNLSVDAEVDNLGSVSVGGAMEVANHSILDNSGTLILMSGGHFKEQANITNDGTIEVSGGTLNVSVDVANSGTIQVDTGATLVLNPSTITGGTVSINGTLELDGTSFLKSGTLKNYGTVNVKGDDAFDGEAVANHNRIEIFAGAALTLDLNTNLMNTSNGALTVDGGGKLTLNGATIDGGTITDKASGEVDLDGNAILNNGTLGNSGTIKASASGNTLNSEHVTNSGAGAIEISGALTLDLGSIISNAAASNTVTVDGAGALTLNNATIGGGAVVNKAAGQIDLTGNGVLKNGTLSNVGTTLVSGAGNALDHETVTASKTLEVMAQGALRLDLGTSITNCGTITVDGAATLTLNDATIDGGAVTNLAAGEIGLTGNAVVKGGTLSNAGTIHVSGTGNKLDGETVTANAMLEVLAGGVLLLDAGTSVANSGTITVDGGATLTLNAATISGGSINDYSVDAESHTLGGLINVTGASTINGNAVLNNGGVTVASGVTLALGNVTVNATAFSDADATLAVGSGHTLTLQNGAAVTGGNLVISGTLHLETSSGAHLDGVTVSGGGAIVVDDPSIEGTLFLADGTSITGGTLTIGAVGTLDIESAAGASLHDVNIGDGNVIEVGMTTTAVLALDGGTTITGGALSVGSGSTLEIANGAIGTDATLHGVHVAGPGTVQVDASATLAFNDGSISGGTLIISGELDARGAIVITSSVVNNGTIEVKSGTLDLEGGLSGAGQIIIDAGAKLEVAGAYIPTVTFNSPDAELQIDTATFAGKIQGLAASDNLDLRTIQYDLGTTATYQDGVLTVVDAHGDSISLTLVGNYSNAHFAATSDGHCGTLITLKANDDAPVASQAQQTASLGESANVTGSPGTDPQLPTSAGGSILFTDVDLTDRPTAMIERQSAVVVWKDAGHDLSSQLTSGEISALENGLSLGPSNNTNNGAIGWTYSITDSALDFLGEGQTVTIDSTIMLDDHLGKSDTAHVIVTITGAEDAPIITAGPQTGAITEIAGVSGAPTRDTASGTITFTDADVTDTHGVTISNVVTVSGAIGGLPDTSTIRSWLSFGTLTDSLHGATGSSTWTFSAQDQTFDYLAAGETVKLTYTAEVSDGHGGVAITPVTITVTGTDDAPTIISTSNNVHPSTQDGHPPSGGRTGAITELVGTTGSPPLDTSQGTISFTDRDSADTHSVTITDVRVSGMTGGLAGYDLKTWLSLGPLIDTKNGAIGSEGWTFSAQDKSFDYLPAGQTAKLIYTVQIDDHHGGIITTPVTITVTGTNDAPTIVSETDPSVQTVILTKSAIALPSSETTNDLHLPTETFDPSSEDGNAHSSYNAQGQASFYSSALHATLTASGDVHVVHGSSSSAAAPFEGPGSGQADGTNYLAIGANGQETIAFDSLQNTFGLYWGSVDSYNTIGFYKSGQLIASYTGSDLGSLVPNGGQNAFASNGYVEFKDLAPFDKVVLGSSQNAFELDNVSAGYVADAHVQLASSIAGTLVVNDPDVGDTLTASVIGKAEVNYNGSTNLPTKINVDALSSASAISFDSVTSDGKSDVLHWTYHPTNASFDFLEPGDTLAITFKAQVSDGHVSLGVQPLTVTIAGTGATVINGTAQNDSFDDVGGGVTVFGNGGHDTFVFKASFGSATIGDFNLSNDVIEIDKSLFTNWDALLGSAHSANADQDTVITDAAHETITLKGVNVAQLSAHSNDFHII